MIFAFTFLEIVVNFEKYFQSFLALLAVESFDFILTAWCSTNLKLEYTKHRPIHKPIETKNMSEL